MGELSACQPCQAEGSDGWMICRVSLTTYMHVRGAGDAAGYRCVSRFVHLCGLNNPTKMSGPTEKSLSTEFFSEYSKSMLILLLLLKAVRSARFPTKKDLHPAEKRGTWYCMHALILKEPTTHCARGNSIPLQHRPTFIKSIFTPFLHSAEPNPLVIIPAIHVPGPAVTQPILFNHVCVDREFP